MTVERIEETEQTDTETPTEQADETAQSEATSDTAQSDPELATEAQAVIGDTDNEAAEPQPEATAEAPAEAAADTQPEAAAEAQAEETAAAEATDEGMPASVADMAAEAPPEPPAAAETQPEAPDSAPDNAQDAAEGDRPLGAADEMAEMVNQAIDQMNETSAEDSAEGSAAPAEAADSDSDASAQADIPAAEPEVVAVAAVPAPRVYEGPEPTTMEELLAEQSTEIRSLKHGDVVEGSVVRIDKDEILVDIGAKSEGVISNRELYGRNAESQPELSIGDVVLVYVLQPESPEGHAVLSLRRAGLERKWRSMQEQLDAGVIIEAPVIDHNKGGLIVDCGIRGFVPISQIVDFPRRPQNEQPRDAAQEIAEKLQPYVGRKLRLKILEVNRKANRLILSEKVALYEERREKRDELFSSLQVGQKVTGTVRSIAPFGVFVDLGGIDGLVHKSELSWNKVNNPEAGYRVGEEVEAEVIDINHERGRISLSIRRLQPDPWHSTVADLKVGDLIDGTVTKIVNFGSFVRVRDGLEGLIHISELSHQRVNHPGDVVHEGQTLKLKIISLDQERHRLGLSLKQAEEAPARPEPSATSTGTGAPRERRPRQERGGYDASQAVQEPEGGIDNTLAAAFAQVRQQIEETEAARGTVAEDEAADAPAADDSAANESPETEATAEATAAEVEAPAAEATAEPAAELAAEPADELATGELTAEPADAMVEMPSAETTAEQVDAPAEASADESESDAKPARKGRAAAKGSAEPAADEDAEPAAPAAEPPAAAEAKAKKGKAAAKAAAEPEEAAAESATDPAEGAADSAPAEGAETEEPSA